MRVQDPPPPPLFLHPSRPPSSSPSWFMLFQHREDIARGVCKSWPLIPWSLITTPYRQYKLPWMEEFIIRPAYHLTRNGYFCEHVIFTFLDWCLLLKDSSKEQSWHLFFFSYRHLTFKWNALHLQCFCMQNIFFLTQQWTEHDHHSLVLPLLFKTQKKHTDRSVCRFEHQNVLHHFHVQSVFT